MVSPLRFWYCTQCGLPVGPDKTTPGLAGRLGWCHHGSNDPQATPKLVVVVETAENADRLREQRLDRQALTRALQKAHTPEGRATLSKREAKMLAERAEDGPGAVAK